MGNALGGDVLSGVRLPGGIPARPICHRNLRHVRRALRAIGRVCKGRATPPPATHRSRSHHLTTWPPHHLTTPTPPHIITSPPHHRRCESRPTTTPPQPASLATPHAHQHHSTTPASPHHSPTDPPPTLTLTLTLTLTRWRRRAMTPTLRLRLNLPWPMAARRARPAQTALTQMEPTEPRTWGRSPPPTAARSPLPPP